MTNVSENLRTAMYWNDTNESWEDVEVAEIKCGMTFMLFEPDGSAVCDGKKYVFIAMSDLNKLSIYEIQIG